MCAQDGKHPYTELMKLLPELEPNEQADVWLQLLSYVQAKPKEEPEEDPLSTLTMEAIIDKLSEHPEVVALLKEKILLTEAKPVGKKK